MSVYCESTFVTLKKKESIYKTYVKCALFPIKC